MSKPVKAFKTANETALATERYESVKLEYDAKSLLLLRKVAKELYTTDNFLEDDMESLSFFREMLKTQNDPNNPHKLCFTVTGKNLDDPKKAELRGFSAGIYNRDSSTATPFYAATHKDFRYIGNLRQTYGAWENELHKMATANGKKLEGCFAIVDNPQKMREQGVEDPMGEGGAEKRIKAYHRGGCRAVNIPTFTQPATNTGLEQMTIFTLTAIPVDGKLPTEKAVLGFITDNYKQCGYENPSTYVPEDGAPSYDTMVSQVKKLGKNLMADMPYKPPANNTGPSPSIQ